MKVLDLQVASLEVAAGSKNGVPPEVVLASAATVALGWRGERCQGVHRGAGPLPIGLALGLAGLHFPLDLGRNAYPVRGRVGSRSKRLAEVQ